MQENQLTQTSQQVLHAAQLLAQKQQHAAVTEEHILAGLLQEDTQVLPYLMQQNNIVFPTVKAALEQHLKRQAKVEGSMPQLSPAAMRCLQNAFQFAQKKRRCLYRYPSSSLQPITKRKHSGPNTKRCRNATQTT